MNWILIVLAVVIFFLIFKNFKHEVFRKSVKLVMLIGLLLIVLTVVVYYVDLGDYFSKDNLSTKTGAAIVKIVKSNYKDKFDIGTEDVEVAIDKTLDGADKSIKKVQKTRK